MPGALSFLSLSGSPLIWAYLVLIVAFFGISIAYRGVRSDPQAIRGPSSDLALFLLVNLAFIVLPFALALTTAFDALSYSLPSSLGIVGIVALGAAVLVRAKAHGDLGKSFSIAPGTTRKREMVTTGIYSRVRHPMYLSMVLWGLATPVVLQNYLVGFAPLVSITVFLLVRLPVEERILQDEFGERYRVYMARTGRLLPRLFR